jgi:hypothetical protein
MLLYKYQTGNTLQTGDSIKAEIARHQQEITKLQSQLRNLQSNADTIGVGKFEKDLSNYNKQYSKFIDQPELTGIDDYLKKEIDATPDSSLQNLYNDELEYRQNDLEDINTEYNFKMPSDTLTSRFKRNFDQYLINKK